MTTDQLHSWCFCFAYALGRLDENPYYAHGDNTTDAQEFASKAQGHGTDTAISTLYEDWLNEFLTAVAS